MHALGGAFWRSARRLAHPRKRVYGGGVGGAPTLTTKEQTMRTFPQAQAAAQQRMQANPIGERLSPKALFGLAGSALDVQEGFGIHDRGDGVAVVTFNGLPFARVEAESPAAYDDPASNVTRFRVTGVDVRPRLGEGGPRRSAQVGLTSPRSFRVEPTLAEVAE